MRKTLLFMIMIVLIVLSACKKKETAANTIEPNDTNLIIPEGALPHLFSISPTQKVFFAKGNLQYKASTNTWRFAENQWDTVGTPNKHRSATYDNWIDLFCYGSSGYNGANPYQFYNNNNLFSVIYKNDISRTNYDWGTYNPISNAGNRAGLWRTLTYDELRYLLFGRAFIGYPFGLCNLKLSDSTEIVGMYICPDGCSFYNDGYYGSNVINMSITEMEKLGIVFLPYTCYMDIYYNNYFSPSHLSVYFWGSSQESISYGIDKTPVDIEFVPDYLWPPHAVGGRYYGGVRLVCDYKY